MHRNARKIIGSPRREGHVLIPFSARMEAPLTKAEMSGGRTSDIVYSKGDKMIVYNTSTSTKCPVLPSMLNLVGGAGCFLKCYRLASVNLEDTAVTLIDTNAFAPALRERRTRRWRR